MKRLDINFQKNVVHRSKLNSKYFIIFNSVRFCGTSVGKTLFVLKSFEDIQLRRRVFTTKQNFTMESTRRVETFHLFVLLLLVTLQSSPSAALEPTTRVHRVGVAGSVASLPCQLPQLPAAPALVLWYRGAATKPFYSYDGRASESKGNHKIHEASETPGRVAFVPTVENFPYQGLVGELQIRSLRLSDAGNYTCRVDFPQAQTRMAMLTLEVHEPIKKLAVLNLIDEEIHGVSGPHKEGSALLLRCRAYGGYPAPTLKWVDVSKSSKFPSDFLHSGRQDEASDASLKSLSYEAVDETNSFSTTSHSEDGMEDSLLQIDALRPWDHGRQLECRASNSRLMDTVSVTVRLDVFYGPASVQIEGLDSPVDEMAGEIVECRAGLSRPTPRISWHPEELFAAAGPTQLLSGNMTVSKARLTASWEDDGKTVSCTATNPSVPRNVKSASKTLRVRFAPRVVAVLAPTIDRHNIKEGDDVYFECSLHANPPPKSVTWLHEDEVLEQGEWSGGLALLHGSSLVLQALTRAAEGVYRCRADNDLGRTTSEGERLRVMYAPECSVKQPSVVSALPDEPIELPCHVDSPTDDVTFQWSVNTSRGMAELDTSLFNMEATTSTLNFVPEDHEPLLLKAAKAGTPSLVGRYKDLRTPTGEEVFGVVYCKASSKFGEQKKPCTYVVKPAGPPEELLSCSLVNLSATTLAVTCSPGHNGGLPQTFSVRVLEEATGVSVANVSSTSPNIVVENLAPGQDYLVEVRAMNAKGESQPFLLQGFALKVAENKIHAPDPNDSNSHLLPVFVGVVAGVVVMALLLILLARLRQRGRRRQAAANSALTAIKKDNSSGFSTGSSGGLDALRPLREVTHRGTITDDLAQECEGETGSMEGRLKRNSSASTKKSDCRGTYDIICSPDLDWGPNARRNKAREKEMRRAHSISYHSLDTRSPEGALDSPEEGNETSSPRSSWIQKLKQAKASNKMDSLQSRTSKCDEVIADSKDSIGQTFSYSSLKRPRTGEDDSPDIVTLIKSPSSDHGGFNTLPACTEQKLGRRESLKASHTQLVNSKGQGELVLDSDNLLYSSKFQNCTRRRDESFV